MNAVSETSLGPARLKQRVADTLPNGKARPASRVDRWLRYPLLRWTNYFKAILPASKNAPKTRFLLLCRPRAGSHFLMSLVQQHPDIHVDNEKRVFHKARFKAHYPAAYLSGLSNSARSPVYLAKTHVNRIAYQGADPKHVLDTLQQQGWRFIYLYREDLLAQAISHVIALERNVTYDTDHNALRDFTITIPVERLEGELARAETILETETALLEKYDCLRLEYGRDIRSSSSQKSTFRRLFAFLDVQSLEMHSPIKKTAPKDLSKTILNYDDLVQYVRRSKYAHFLDADGRF